MFLPGMSLGEGLLRGRILNLDHRREARASDQNFVFVQEEVRQSEQGMRT